MEFALLVSTAGAWVPVTLLPSSLQEIHACRKSGTFQMIFIIAKAIINGHSELKKTRGAVTSPLRELANLLLSVNPVANRNRKSPHRVFYR